jgi:hypothetical protein
MSKFNTSESGLFYNTNELTNAQSFENVSALCMTFSVIDDEITMYEQMPMSLRPQHMADLYLERLRLRDKINFFTPPPPRESTSSMPVLTALPELEEVLDEQVIDWGPDPRRAGKSRCAWKNYRRRCNRRKRRQEREELDQMDDFVIDMVKNADVPVTQSGKVRTVYERNFSRFVELGFNKKELEVIKALPTIKTVIFSDKLVRRHFRELLQRRSAAKKLAEYKASLDHVSEAKYRTELRKLQREDKIVNQSPLLAASVLIGACSVALSSFKIKRSACKLTEQVSGFIGEIKQGLIHFSKKLDHLGLLTKMILTVGLCYFLKRTFQHPLINLAIVAAVAVIFKGEVRQFLSDFFSQEEAEEVTTQSGDTSNPLAVLLAGGVLVTLGMQNSRKALLPMLVGAVGVLPRTVKGVEAIIDFCVKALERMVNTLLVWFGRPEIRFRKELDSAIEAAIKDATEIDKILTGTDFQNNQTPKMFQRCASCYHKLKTLTVVHCENVKAKSTMAPYIANLYGHLGTLRACLGRGAGFRREPLSVVIEGDPGVGKTLNVPVLIATVLYEAGLIGETKAEDLHQVMFSKPANSDYYDGYYGQECYLIDDFCARKPNPSGTTEFDEVMAFYGTTTCILNMADLPKKGMYPFTSSLLMMTTNLKNLQAVGADAILLCPDAFKRRIDIHVHLQVRREYQHSHPTRVGQLDHAKFEAECAKLLAQGKTGIDAHPWYIWEAFDTTFGVETTFPEGTGRPFDEVVHEIIDGLRRKSDNHEKNMKHLANVFARKPAESTSPVVNQSGDEIVRYGSTESFPEIEPLPTCDTPPMNLKVKIPFDPDQSHFGKSYDPNPFTDPNMSARTRQRLMQERVMDWFMPSEDAGAREIIIKHIRTYGTLFLMAKLVIMPLADALCALVRSIMRRIFGVKAEEHSNGPPSKATVYKMPVQQAADFSLWSKAYKASYKMMVAVGAEDYAPFGQIIFLAGNLAVMPHHFLQQIDRMRLNNEINNESRLVFKSCDGSVNVESTIGAFLSYKSLSFVPEDIHFVHFKKGFKMYPNIIKFVCTEADLPLLSGRSVRLDTAAADENGFMLPKCQRVTYTTDSVKFSQVRLRTDTREYKQHFSYAANTSFGDCGAPLCVVDYRAFNNRCLMGLHVAGTRAPGHGYATPLTQEMCQKAFDHFKPTQIVEATPEESQFPKDIALQSIDVVPFTSDGCMGNATPLYEVDKSTSIPVKSSLVKTFIGREELFKEVITEMNEGREPPRLVPMKMGRYKNAEGEVVYPMAEAVKPYVEGMFLPADDSFTLGLSAGLKPFADASRDYIAPVLTKEQAVLGEPALSLKSITRATSVGYPLCLVAKNKKHYFGSDSDMDVTTPEAVALFEQIDKLVSLLKEGKRPLFVCKDFLKDEVRKEGKKARLIAGTDLRYYILCRMYFGAFVGAVCRSHEKTGLCLGMNPYSEWGTLRAILEKPDPKGVNVWDGDFAGFDSSQMPQLLWECLYYMNNWYSIRGGTSEDNVVRTTLFYDLVYSRHIMSYNGPATTIVEWCKSLPSGHFLTAVINSMLSMGLVASGFVALTGHTDFWSNAAAVVLGDDNVVATSDEFKEQFNQVTLARYLKSAFGMEYTAGRKGEELRPFIGIKDVVFLQRRFSVKDGADVCPIRPESFLHSLYYVSSNDEHRNRETLLASIELAFEELSMHDEKYWNLAVPILVEAKRRLGESPNLSTLDSTAYLHLVRNRVPSYI